MISRLRLPPSSAPAAIRSRFHSFSSPGAVIPCALGTRCDRYVDGGFTTSKARRRQKATRPSFVSTNCCMSVQSQGYCGHTRTTRHRRQTVSHALHPLSAAQQMHQVPKRLAGSGVAQSGIQCHQAMELCDPRAVSKLVRRLSSGSSTACNVSSPSVQWVGASQP